MPRLNTQKHVKIWFSEVPDEPFGGSENTYHLIMDRLRHPDHEINVIVYKALLSETGIETLNKFSEKFKINIIDFSELEKKFELEGGKKNKLIKLAKEEINNKYGNLAGASDIVRWLVLDMGIYNDLDNKINYQNVPKEIEIADFLIVLRNLPPQEDQEDSVTGSFSVNNCVLAFPDPNHKLIETVHEILLKNYGGEEGKVYAADPMLIPRDEDKYFDSVWKFREFMNLDADEYEGDLKYEIIYRSGPGVLIQALRQNYTEGRPLRIENFNSISPWDISLLHSPLGTLDNLQINSNESFIPSGAKKFREKSAALKESIISMQSLIRRYNVQMTFFNSSSFSNPLDTSGPLEESPTNGSCTLTPGKN